MSLAAIDALVTPILAELETKQATALTKNGKYAQLFPSHDTVPETPTACKPGLLRDEDIMPAVDTLPFAFRVDEYIGDDYEGWVLGVWAIDGGVTYLKWWVYGPEIANYPTGWNSTWNEESGRYLGPLD
jgi:hypothetical protein